MNQIEKSKISKRSWLSLVLLAIVIAIMAGCNQVADEGGAGTADDYAYELSDPDEVEAVYGPSDEDYENQSNEFEHCCHILIDPNTVVATINNMDITAGAVMDELPWVLDGLMWEYIQMFPEDMAFNFDRIFWDDMTFGRVVLEEAAQIAALVALYEDFGRQRGIEISFDTGEHPVMQIIEAIMNDPDKMAEFADYLPEDNVEEAREKAESLLARALAGEDFVELIHTYGEDPGMEFNPDGYTFTHGAMVPEFENATIELEIGEISGLVQTQFGFHIIKRVEPIPENAMPGPMGLPPGEGDELFGAKHILIMAVDTTSEPVRFDAIITAFGTKHENANIEFLSALDDIPLG